MIAIIDYGINNLDSIKNALDKLSIPAVVTCDATVINQARILVLPGVGAAATGMNNLKMLGLDKLLTSEVRNGKPLLGICLGMQLLMDWSEEGNVHCLGFVDGIVEKFTDKLKVPQIGWNQMQIIDVQSPLLTDIPDTSDFYFVHSYFCNPDDKNVIVGTTIYGQPFCSIMKQDNIVGVQFHPEKSGKIGFQLLQNIINYFLL
ncbi:imidazole glycerol phosphate synthase subunit HisH [Candidatus Roizmanbacteria bacterium CG11_big_fil_rev_8_21_14_0_20_36_8]|uniref:Imidazole glycerol phosphate synthase subunit HisH n=2 Tax=Candidatus Roizmaniibacteriota TaxID=1752723 RepID=A0A2M6ITZ7_9BACT|nr:MAG: imidazole glycerol phosphate synthase subunit HisH [Candidatus Roizmanbacteria bacterium CG11_big_fil_rev_8_21_14_0_20_36_8]PIZ64431.1 MAG: imidazole glycerol phosphate synthase subunit HisH [Candidatus Roizmanbacteria bacterium CG_4_10_14_0_2_um_filter_36_9]